jgi:hypothetical protein
MPQCKLCHKDRELRNSHIVPEFLWGDLYNSKRQILGVHGVGKKGTQLLQKGIREHLFCECCEQHFNEYFEKAFRVFWVQNCPLPDPWPPDHVQAIKADYAAFKLFHLSILFRAGVSTLPTFAEVALGPHEEVLRQMLLSRDPGPEDRYPIFAYAVVHHRSQRLVQMVSKGQAARLGGRRCYGTMYGGAQWWVCVARDRNPEFQQVALRADGTMDLAAVPWNEIAVIQEASQALRDAST